MHWPRTGLAKGRGLPPPWQTQVVAPSTQVAVDKPSQVALASPSQVAMAPPSQVAMGAVPGQVMVPLVVQVHFLSHVPLVVQVHFLAHLASGVTASRTQAVAGDLQHRRQMGQTEEVEEVQVQWARQKEEEVAAWGIRQPRSGQPRARAAVLGDSSEAVACRCRRVNALLPKR